MSSVEPMIVYRKKGATVKVHKDFMCAGARAVPDRVYPERDHNRMITFITQAMATDIPDHFIQINGLFETDDPEELIDGSMPDRRWLLVILTDEEMSRAVIPPKYEYEGGRPKPKTIYHREKDGGRYFMFRGSSRSKEAEERREADRELKKRLAAERKKEEERQKALNPSQFQPLTETHRDQITAAQKRKRQAEEKKRRDRINLLEQEEARRQKSRADYLVGLLKRTYRKIGADGTVRVVSGRELIGRPADNPLYFPVLKLSERGIGWGDIVEELGSWGIDDAIDGWLIEDMVIKEEIFPDRSDEVEDRLTRCRAQLDQMLARHEVGRSEPTPYSDLVAELIRRFEADGRWWANPNGASDIPQRPHIPLPSVEAEALRFWKSGTLLEEFRSIEKMIQSVLRMSGDRYDHLVVLQQEIARRLDRIRIRIERRGSALLVIRGQNPRSKNSINQAWMNFQRVFNQMISAVAESDAPRLGDVRQIAKQGLFWRNRGFVIAVIEAGFETLDRYTAIEQLIGHLPGDRGRMQDRLSRVYQTIAHLYLWRLRQFDGWDNLGNLLADLRAAYAAIQTAREYPPLPEIQLGPSRPGRHWISPDKMDRRKKGVKDAVVAKSAQMKRDMFTEEQWAGVISHPNGYAIRSPTKLASNVAVLPARTQIRVGVGSSSSESRKSERVDSAGAGTSTQPREKKKPAVQIVLGLWSKFKKPDYTLDWDEVGTFGLHLQVAFSSRDNRARQLLPEIEEWAQNLMQVDGAEEYVGPILEAIENAQRAGKRAETALWWKSLEVRERVARTATGPNYRKELIKLKIRSLHLNELIGLLGRLNALTAIAKMPEQYSSTRTLVEEDLIKPDQTAQLLTPTQQQAWIDLVDQLFAETFEAATAFAAEISGISPESGEHRLFSLANQHRGIFPELKFKSKARSSGSPAQPTKKKPVASTKKQQKDVARAARAKARAEKARAEKARAEKAKEKAKSDNQKKRQSSKSGSRGKGNGSKGK